MSPLVLLALFGFIQAGLAEHYEKRCKRGYFWYGTECRAERKVKMEKRSDGVLVGDEGVFPVELSPSEVDTRTPRSIEKRSPLMAPRPPTMATRFPVSTLF